MAISCVVGMQVSMQVDKREDEQTVEQTELVQHLYETWKVL